MEVKIDLKQWSVKEVAGHKKIIGTYTVKAGATEVASQSFNDEYGSTNLAFPTELILEVEKVTEKIKEHITKLFT